MDKLAHTIPAVCAITGLGRTSIYAAIKAGRLIATKIGARTLIRHEDLVAFLDAGRQVAA